LVINVAFFQFRRQAAAECQEATGAICASRVIMHRVRGSVQAKKCANLHRPAAKLEVAQKWRGTHFLRITRPREASALQFSKNTADFNAALRGVAEKIFSSRSNYHHSG